jgi:hypothetical protein
MMSLKKEKAADKKEFIMKRLLQLKHKGLGANQGAQKGRAMMRFFPNTPRVPRSFLDSLYLLLLLPVARRSL